MPMRDGLIPDYTISFVLFGGDPTGEVLALNVHGHGHDPDVVDLVLRHAERELLISGVGGWEVREDWLRQVPTGDGARHLYGGPGRGARPVTVIQRALDDWPYWCTNHLMEPAWTGIRADCFVDGDSHVSRRLAELETEIDPRVDVKRGSGDTCLVYLCKFCYSAFARQTGRRTLGRLKAAVGEEPDRQVRGTTARRMARPARS